MYWLMGQQGEIKSVRGGRMRFATWLAASAATEAYFGAKAAPCGVQHG